VPVTGKRYLYLIYIYIYIYIYIKQRVREAKYLPPFSAQVKNENDCFGGEGKAFHVLLKVMTHHFLSDRLANTGVFVWIECFFTKNCTWDPWDV